MPPLDPARERELIRERVEQWRAAEPVMRAVRENDDASVTRQEAIRQIFEGMDFIFAEPAPPTSGLVEQQKWFTKIREAASKKKGE